jgi:hypothetical protein
MKISDNREKISDPASKWGISKILDFIGRYFFSLGAGRRADPKAGPQLEPQHHLPEALHRPVGFP